MTIDWDEIRRGYNERFSAEHSNIYDFLLELYSNTKSLTEMDRILGISITTLTYKMKSLGIKIQPKGSKHGGRTPKITNRILAVQNSEKLTAYEIARKSGCTVGMVWYVCRKFKKPYKKMPSGWKALERREL